MSSPRASFAATGEPKTWPTTRAASAATSGGTRGPKIALQTSRTSPIVGRRWPAENLGANIGRAADALQQEPTSKRRSYGNALDTALRQRISDIGDGIMPR